MIKLNKMEQNEYNAFIVAVVPSLLPGTYHFRDFFTNAEVTAYPIRWLKSSELKS